MAPTNPQRIVDAHIHWFDARNPYKHPRDHSSSPDHYTADADGYNVVGIVQIEAHWATKGRIGETRWVRRLAEAGKERRLLKGIVGEADTSADAFDRLLDGHAQDRGARS